MNEHAGEGHAVTTLKTLQYLEACSKIFEKGFLSHDMIKDIDSRVLKSIEEGYSFFTRWIDWILKQGMSCNTHAHIMYRVIFAT